MLLYFQPVEDHATSAVLGICTSTTSASAQKDNVQQKLGSGSVLKNPIDLAELIIVPPPVVIERLNQALIVINLSRQPGRLNVQSEG